MINKNQFFKTHYFNFLSGDKKDKIYYKINGRIYYNYICAETKEYKLGCFNFKFENNFNKYFDFNNDKELFLNIMYDLEDDFLEFENNIYENLKERFNETDYQVLKIMINKEFDNIFKAYKTYKNNRRYLNECK